VSKKLLFYEGVTTSATGTTGNSIPCLYKTKSKLCVLFSAMNRGVHKLALVSKLLLDKEVIHLRQENEALRLKLFWKEHNRSELSDRMREANQAHKGPGARVCHVLCLAERKMKTRHCHGGLLANLSHGLKSF
jgi:hypothetical protein